MYVVLSECSHVTYSRSLHVLPSFLSMAGESYPAWVPSQQVQLPFTRLCFTQDMILVSLSLSLVSGSGYRSYRILPDALHAFVDSHELTSAQGVFKVLSLLDPAHKRSPDIASYFLPPGGSGGADIDDGALPEVPVAGLRQQGGRGK